MADDRSKDKLKRLIEKEITAMFEKVLDYAQVACPTPDTYKVLRSKILRVGNNCIRNMNTQLDSRYGVEYKAPAEDFIEVKNSK